MQEATETLFKSFRWNLCRWNKGPRPLCSITCARWTLTTLINYTVQLRLLHLMPWVIETRVRKERGKMPAMEDMQCEEEQSETSTALANLMLLLHHVLATVRKVWIPFPSQDLRRDSLCSQTHVLCNRVLATFKSDSVLCSLHHNAKRPSLPYAWPVAIICQLIPWLSGRRWAIRMSQMKRSPASEPPHATLSSWASASRLKRIKEAH